MFIAKSFFNQKLKNYFEKYHQMMYFVKKKRVPIIKSVSITDRSVYQAHMKLISKVISFESNIGKYDVLPDKRGLVYTSISIQHEDSNYKGRFTSPNDDTSFRLISDE